MDTSLEKGLNDEGCDNEVLKAPRVIESDRFSHGTSARSLRAPRGQAAAMARLSPIYMVLKKFLTRHSLRHRESSSTLFAQVLCRALVTKAVS